MVDVAQWLEFQIVDLAVAGSNPVIHPIVFSEAHLWVISIPFLIIQNFPFSSFSATSATSFATCSGVFAPTVSSGKYFTYASAATSEVEMQFTLIPLTFNFVFLPNF